MKIGLVLMVLAASGPSLAQPDCGAAVEIQRVQIENRYRSGGMDTGAYQAARVRIEESAAACRAGQYVPAPIQVPSPAPPPVVVQPPTLLPSQTTPQGLQIPSPR